MAQHLGAGISRICGRLRLRCRFWVDGSRTCTQKASAGNVGDESTVADRFSALWSMFKSKPPAVPPVDLIRRWQAQGNQFTKPILKLLLKQLRLDGRFDEATKVLKWTVAESPFELTSREYLMRIKLAGRERKLQLARRIFASVPPEMRTPELSTALLAAHTAQNECRRAEEILQTFTPTTAEAYNLMMLMYLRMGLDAKAREVATRLKTTVGFGMDETSICVLAKYRDRLGVELDEEEADRVLAETMKQLKSKKDMFASAKNVMLAYGYLSREEQVGQTWNTVERLPGLPVDCCAAAVESFALVGNVDKGLAAAEKVRGKQKSAKDFYPSLVWLYAKNGMLDKAEGVISEMESKGLGVTYASYDRLIAGYLEHRQQDMAVKKLEEAYSMVRVNSRPAYETVLALLPVFAQRRDVKGAETMVNVYKGWKDVRLFNGLLKVYIAANRSVDNFKARLNAAGVVPDHETRDLLLKALKS